MGRSAKTFKLEETRSLLNRLEIHHTPKHGSWLNMEIEPAAPRMMLLANCDVMNIAMFVTLIGIATRCWNIDFHSIDGIRCAQNAHQLPGCPALRQLNHTDPRTTPLRGMID